MPEPSEMKYSGTRRKPWKGRAVASGKKSGLLHLDAATQKRLQQQVETLAVASAEIGSGSEIPDFWMRELTALNRGHFSRGVIGFRLTN